MALDGQCVISYSVIKPTIHTTGALAAFYGTPSVASTVQTYTVSGANLAANIVITPPTSEFQLSLDGSTWVSSLSLTPSGGTVTDTTIYVRLNTASSGSYSGSLSHTSTGAAARNMAVSGYTNQSMDFGNLPSAYTGMNLLSQGGAWSLTGSTYLGATVTSEGDSPNTAAFIPEASDDGVTWTGSWSAGIGYATVNVTCPSGACYLYGWADWNNDKDFEDANEIIYASTLTTIGNGNKNISFAYPGGSVLPAGNYYARFRVYAAHPSNPQPSGAPLGSAPIVGEVEDHIIKSDGGGGTPTPVSLSYFLAQRQGDNVKFDWSTETESGNVGFNLYGRAGSQLERINPKLIPSQNINSLERQDYYLHGPGKWQQLLHRRCGRPGRYPPAWALPARPGLWHSPGGTAGGLGGHPAGSAGSVRRADCQTAGKD